LDDKVAGLPVTEPSGALRILYALNLFEQVTEQNRRERANLWTKSRLPQNSHVNLASDSGGDTVGVSVADAGETNGSEKYKPQLMSFVKFSESALVMTPIFTDLSTFCMVVIRNKFQHN